MNTITRKELNDSYLNNERAVANAKKYFDGKQPSIWTTGSYSAPSWNWSYRLGIVGVNSFNYDTNTKNDVQYFEVVTQFGEVVAAREINLPQI